MTPDDEYQEILQDLMEGPPKVFSIFIELWDDTMKLETFSTEEDQLDRIEYLKDNVDRLSIKHLIMFESLVDVTEEDDYLFTVH